MRRYHEEMREYMERANERAEEDPHVESYSVQEMDNTGEGVVIEMDDIMSGQGHGTQQVHEDSNYNDEYQDNDDDNNDDDNRRLLDQEQEAEDQHQHQHTTGETEQPDAQSNRRGLVPPELPVIVRSSRSQRRRRRKRIDRFYACSFAVGLVILSSTLVLLALKLDKVVDTPLGIIFAIPLLYVSLQSAALLLFGVHLWKFIRSPMWAYIYNGLALALLTSFTVLLYFNLSGVFISDIALFTPVVSSSVQ